MSNYNLCFNGFASCSACCGLYNIDLNQNDKKKWLIENTQNFLRLDLNDRTQVLKFRNAGEDHLQKLIIKADVYVCPFMGFIEAMPDKIGCLLHDGSPHEQVKMIESPLSFSFYGESVCKAYDCINKQYMNEMLAHKNSNDLSVELLDRMYTSFNDVLRSNFIDNPGLFTYGKFISNHNLWAACVKIVEKNPGSEKNLMSYVIKNLDKKEIPVTSFEMPISFDFFTDEEIWHVLGTLFSSEGYIFDAFKITQSGKDDGEKLKVQIQTK
ncbi:MAG: hypothetical protein OEV78_10305 [Spirochaetia bacterium]|nr:hypothetical protein [Spirochaetia bacterium]